MVSREAFSRLELRMAALFLLTVTTAGACSSPAQPTPTPAAPKITCPNDVTAVSVDSNPVAVTYPGATVAGGAAPVAVACTPPSGSTFSPGVAAVTCVATDRLGRSDTCGFAVRVSVPPRLQSTRFLAYGDSLTEGKIAVTAPIFKLVDFPGSYPSVLETLLKARYTAQTITMTKEGHGGMDTAWALVNLPGYIAAYRPEAVLLLWGANDLSGGDAATIDRAVGNMSRVVEEAKAAGATVFLAALPPQVQGGTRAGGYALVPVYNEKLRAVATSMAARFVDLYTPMLGGTATYVGVDGLHLTSAGYERVADIFFSVIQGTLETPGAATTSAASRPRMVPSGGER